MAQKHAPQSESSDDDEPSPEVIAERAAAIRATWTEREERLRRVCHGRVEWELPVIGSEWIGGVKGLSDDSQLLHVEAVQCEKT